ncbi:MAG: universal stress protein [Kangiellaceae bacterium]|jgi:universal stress protein E
MRELLVIADQNADSNPAFLHALEVAKNTGAKIEFVGFVHAAGVDSSEILTQSEKRKVHHEFIDRKQAQIDSFLSNLDLTGVRVNVDVVWERSFERWVTDRCNQKSFDMIFKTGHRTESTTHAPSDWQLMRHCPDPVMIVGDKEWKNGGKVLAALDLGSSSEEALKLNEEILKYSFQLAKATNSEVHACYSISMPSALAELDFFDTVGYEKKMKESIDPIISRLIEKGGLNQETLHLVSGKPAKEIRRIVKKIDADVVVMGNKTRVSLRGRLLGNTARNVLRKIKADVLIVK